MMEDSNSKESKLKSLVSSHSDADDFYVFVYDE